MGPARAGNSGPSCCLPRAQPNLTPVSSGRCLGGVMTSNFQPQGSGHIRLEPKKIISHPAFEAFGISLLHATIFSKTNVIFKCFYGVVV